MNRIHRHLPMLFTKKQNRLFACLCLHTGCYTHSVGCKQFKRTKKGFTKRCGGRDRKRWNYRHTILFTHTYTVDRNHVRRISAATMVFIPGLGMSNRLPLCRSTLLELSKRPARPYFLYCCVRCSNLPSSLTHLPGFVTASLHHKPGCHTFL